MSMLIVECFGARFVRVFCALFMMLLWSSTMAGTIDFDFERADGAKVGMTWNDVDPVGFIKLLQEHPGQFIRVTLAPQGWIAVQHVPQLIAMLDSREPAARVCSVLPPAPIDGGSASTIGLEALKILEAYRKGRSYMPDCTAWHRRRDDKDIQEMRQWWLDQQNVARSDKVAAPVPDASEGLLTSLLRRGASKPVSYDFVGTINFDYSQLRRKNGTLEVPVSFSGGQWMNNSGLVPYAIKVKEVSEDGGKLGLFATAVEMTVLVSLPPKGRQPPLMLKIDRTFSATPVKLIYVDPDGTRHDAGILSLPKGSQF